MNQPPASPARFAPTGTASLPNNFLALEKPFCDYATARIVVVQAPFDGTASYRTGSREGPREIIAASRALELYDEELGLEPYRLGITTLEEPLLPRNIEGALGDVRKLVERVASDGKMPLMLGGDHILSYAAIDALAACRAGEAFSVIVFDAHTDLRDTYEGTRWSHACTVRRIQEIVPSIAIVGVRSTTKEEIELASEQGIDLIFAHQGFGAALSQLRSTLPKLRAKIYISIDVDALDCSTMPSAATPEPGGFTYTELLSLLRTACGAKEVIGCDIMELAPIPGLVAPNFLTAKLAYKLIAYTHALQKRPTQPSPD